MGTIPIFLSLVCIVRNQASALEDIIADITKTLSPLVADYELIIVDNASTDNSVSLLKGLTGSDGFPNLQIYALTNQVDVDTATWAGIENALGDYVAVFDPENDAVHILPEMLNHAIDDTDIVFADNIHKRKQKLTYRVAHTIFKTLYKCLNGEHVSHETPTYRILARRVINFILQHPNPVTTYRHLTRAMGFSRTYVKYKADPTQPPEKKLFDAIDRGIRLLVSTTQAPMRLVTTLSLFGASANLIYSIYVIAIAILKTDVAEGWVSLSLQQSGMFFLISLVLLVLGEYILHMTSLSNEGPLYHISQEFNSEVISRKEKLNVEDVSVTIHKAQSDINGSKKNDISI